MTTWRTVALGAIAGLTIFLGLPMGRLKNPRARVKALLNAASAGILLFLLFEIFHGAFEPLEEAVEHLHEGDGGWGPVLGMGAVLVAGLAGGLLSLLYLSRWQSARRSSPKIGPGAMATVEAEASSAEMTRSALTLGLSIASGIGLHNFSEGLAIGQAATSGQIDLALLLVVGFALHNATEGFGIIGPLAAGGVRASWPYLLLAGLLAGGPTFLGTVVGLSFQNDYVYVAFLALAAGAIIYVVAELLNTGRRLGAWDMTVWGVLGGIVAGAATELVIKAAGG
ncbi:MAG TPA: ZIP family metal transporter [Actinomycetota bacterium]|jgi:ZIP family zinc transporter